MPVIATRPVTATPPTPGFRPHRLTVERYQHMVEAGIFTADEPIFLWKGQLVEKMTKGPPHNTTSAVLIAILIRMVPAGWHVRPEQPVILDDDSVPEPDLMVVRGAIRDFSHRLPAARDLALLVEIADSSLVVDSGEKREEYARAEVSCYWIINIPQRRIEVYQRPSGPVDAPSFAECSLYGPEDEVPVILDDHEIGRIAVRDLLP